MDSIFEAFKPGDPTTVDQRIVLDGVPWELFVAIAEKRDAARRPGVRLHYADGALELMTTSMPHEYLKTALARCLEIWAEHVGVELEGYGQWAIMNRRSQRAAEADECYFIGSPGRRTKPDLAIEIVWTHGGLDKLDVYRKLGVGEVWIWEDGHIGVYVFDAGAWRRRSESRLLPDADLRLFERCVATGTQTKALRMLRRALKH